ncbi:MAG: ParB/RepB/Spo0J family partition protein [Angelakisella sp.]
MKIDLTAQKPRQQFTAADLSGLLGGQAPVGAAITQLPIGRLVPYPNQPFKPYSAEKLERLTEDIRVNGVLSPIIVRPSGNMYEILAGHNRWNASRKAGKDTIPAIVQDVNDDTAALIMVNTNLNQRDELLPSEKAWAYRVQLEAMKRQGKRSDLTSSQLGTKLKRSDQEMAAQMGESRNQIQRYIRLTYLIPELLEMVDTKELPMTPAVDLSYLSVEEQQLVLEVTSELERKVSMCQSAQLKKLSTEGGLDEDSIREVLLPEQRWDARQEFVARSRTVIPTTANRQDVEKVLLLVKQYFDQRVG